VPAANFLRQRPVLRRIKFGQSGADHRNGTTFRGERALVSSRINAARQSANHGEPRVSKLVGELLGRFRAVMGGASRADNADSMIIALVEFAPDVEHNWRRMDLA